MATQDVFVRKASGLVRNLSSFDALNVNVAMCSPLQGVLWAWTFGPYMFQQVNLVLAYFIGMIVVGCGAALAYTLWTIGRPRSGGDYIWFSRTVHPVYGFVINFFLTFVFLNWFAMNSATFGPFFIGSVTFNGKSKNGEGCGQVISHGARGQATKVSVFLHRDLFFVILLTSYLHS